MEMTPKKLPNTLAEAFKNWQDDDIREPELDWGEAVGNELKWQSKAITLLLKA
ncbi:hypothetical protein [Periweissella ghanensis]|uniref:Uncharacterized protein n=1 Tax=Periweissella ghanensis TaxID=467997 RepID=A0ABN8BNB4_9LACO|nr:hypothetical protein [Periweissella ghanensis]MCM0601225.1 hypothetical protein [Periweissella ghanensis]CAH0418025.1 hypothetical protein WGH24286_00441 [Periweissella ghanensis]